MTTLYRQVADQILEQIASGERKVGDRLPPEADFAVELGVSRSTLRLAFDQLETSGVLRRQKRVGTEIIAAKPQQRFILETSSIHNILTILRSNELQVLRSSFVDSAKIAELEKYLDFSGRWLEVFGYRVMPNELKPLCTNRIYVPEEFAAVNDSLAETQESVLTRIESMFSLTVGRVVSSVRAIACPAEEAEIVCMEEGAPALRTETEYFSADGRLIEFVVSYYDSERFQMQSDVSIE